MLKYLSDVIFPHVEKIVLVQDNLHTHRLRGFYDVLTPQDATRYIDRFEMHYTPIHASWLNMVEIDFSALSKQCLNRRIGEIAILTKEVYSWVKERDRLKTKINWQFSKNKARDKFVRFYNQIRN